MGSAIKAYKRRFRPVFAKCGSLSRGNALGAHHDTPPTWTRNAGAIRMFLEGSFPANEVASMPQKEREPELPLFDQAKRVNDPERALELLAKEARGCTRCPLYLNATQTVCG